MENKSINSGQAPTPIGPYSQAVLSGNTLFCSGQVALDHQSGKLQTENRTKETHQVMKNLEAVLKEAGMTFSDVVKCSIFLKDMGDFQEVNAVYGSYFTSTFPARETVQVAALPLNVNVEISLIAIKG
jgi:2-iminobutanoate/2-iminopropanoate deaminase